MAEHNPDGVAADQLDEADLEREVRQLHATRSDTFFDGSEDALARHTERMLALEGEYARRFPDRVKADPQRTRQGSRTAAGQDA